MKIKICAMFPIIMTLFSCGSINHSYFYLKNMKSYKYFEGDAQIALAQAVAKGNIQGIDDAIERGANVNQVGKEEMTPLAWAFAKQNKESFKHLLQKGANPHFKTNKISWNNNGHSVMQFASLSEDPEYLKLVMKYGGNPNAPDMLPGKTIIFTAIRNRRHENIKTLLRYGANINHQDQAGFTPIMEAENHTSYDIVYLLIEMGADLSIRNHVMGRDGIYRKNSGQTLAEQIHQMGDRSIRVLGKEKEQREWYNKVIGALRYRGLI